MDPSKFKEYQRNAIPNSANTTNTKRLFYVILKERVGLNKFRFI